MKHLLNVGYTVTKVIIRKNWNDTEKIGRIGSRLSLYRNGRGFKSRPLQDSVFLNTLSISPVLVVSVCCADVESLYLI